MVELEPKPPEPKLRVLYDGGCGQCIRSVKILHGLDFGGVLEYLDLEDEAQAARAPGVTRDQALAAMHVLDVDGELYRGFFALAGAVGFRWVSAPAASARRTITRAASARHTIAPAASRVRVSRRSGRSPKTDRSRARGRSARWATTDLTSRTWRLSGRRPSIPVPALRERHLAELERGGRIPTRGEHRGACEEQDGENRMRHERAVRESHGAASRRESSEIAVAAPHHTPAHRRPRRTRSHVAIKLLSAGGTGKLEVRAPGRSARGSTCSGRQSRAVIG
jgi:predicted DCC family thiol-disulfide oxidoreductase YuxK